MYVRTFPPLAPSSGLCLLWGLFWPKSKQCSPNLSKWLESKQNGPNSSNIAQTWSENPNSGPSLWLQVCRFWPDLGHFHLDLGHIAWIGAIWQNLGQNRPQRRQNPKDGAGWDEWTNWRMDRWMEGQIPSVLQDFAPFGATALLSLNWNHQLLKQGTDIADHQPPLGCD